VSLKIFESQELVNPVELGKAIDIDAATVRKWIVEGWLPAVDMRSPGTSRPRWRISKAGYDLFIKGRSNATPTKVTRRSKKASDGLEEFFPEMGASS